MEGVAQTNPTRRHIHPIGGAMWHTVHSRSRIPVHVFSFGSTMDTELYDVKFDFQPLQ